MNNYDNELFDFLATEENLNALIIAKNQFPNVRKKLIQDFWNEVKRQIEDGLGENRANWEVILEENITNWFSKLYIKERKVPILENRLPSFIFCWQRLNQNFPFFGFWINEQTKSYNIEKVSEYVATIHRENFSEYKEYDEWFLIWDGVEEFNLSNDQTLLQIVPSVMNEKAKDFADRLLELFSKTQVHYQFIQNNFKI